MYVVVDVRLLLLLLRRVLLIASINLLLLATSVIALIAVIVVPVVLILVILSPLLVVASSFLSGSVVVSPIILSVRVVTLIPLANVTTTLVLVGPGIVLLGNTLIPQGPVVLIAPIALVSIDCTEV